MSDTKAVAGLAIHTEAVRPEWIDYNVHMNVGYYVLAFDHATDALLDHVGMGPDYRKKTNGSAFVVEAHVTYQQEVTEGTKLAFKTLVLGMDAKRIHLFHTMLKADDETPVATNELMILHVDLGTRRTAPIPDSAAAKLAALVADHAKLPRPKEAGKSIAIPAAK